MNLIFLFASLMCDMVASRILELTSQFNWPMALLKLDVSLSFNLQWGCVSCSLFSGMVFKLSAYVFWSVLIDI